MENLRNWINDDFFKFVDSNIDCRDITALRLKNPANFSFNLQFAITQIECRQRCKNKIANVLAEFPRLLFPKEISSEQCTASVVANLHASLFDASDVVLDMTCGLGIDALHIAKTGASVTALEIDPLIAAVAKHNFEQALPNFTVHNTDSVEFIANTNLHFTKIFIDPARRDGNNKRQFSLADCLPNVIDLLPDIKEHCSTLIIKLSPMVDISKLLTEVPCISDIYIVGIKNECKEILAVADFCAQHDVMIHTINFSTDGEQHFNFSLASPAPQCKFANPQPQGFLLEPNACIMKSLAFNALAANYSIAQIAQNSHLFLSDAKIEDFPGRQFIINDVIEFNGKTCKQFAKLYPQCNVATRNFKLRADELRSRLKTRDGGNIYVFGSTLSSGSQVLIVCSPA